MNDYDIIKLQNIAYVNSQIACAQIELAAMQAENTDRFFKGESPAYQGKEFMALIDRYQLGHNSVVTNLHSEF